MAHGSPESSAPEKAYAAVVFDRPMRRVYHYRVPSALRPVIAPGKRVRVSFGQQHSTEGYCVGLETEVNVPEGKIKDILEVLDSEPLLSAAMLTLARRVSDHYCCSWGEVLQAALPRGVRQPAARRAIQVVQLARPEAEIIEWAKAQRETRLAKRARALRVLAQEIQGEVTPFELAGICMVSKSVIDALRRDGFVRYADRFLDCDAFDVPQGEPETPPSLNGEQQGALEAIRRRLASGGFGVILVQGVTGSGKTEVYLRAIEDIVQRGQQAIVLVPEIALTPQTVRRFRSRFSQLSVLHSRQTESQRRDQWERIRRGESQVVIGARSAVFAPVPRLGIIVVDEEHENSYKQENTPRYHGRDVAVMRAETEGTLVLLGSATPALETFNNWKTGKYERVVLRSRVENRELPPVELVDMNQEFAGAKHWSFLSRRLTLLMGEALDRGEQVLLFLNRRGFSTRIKCLRCGFVLGCDQCSAAMTYYQLRHLAVCLHCRKEVDPPEFCPVCRAGKLRYFGVGTEKVEEEVRRVFPGYPVARTDSDTMRGRGAFERQFADFREGRICVLVGTQMVSKGLDLPNVTLVGVICADTSIDLPDFRAFERTFQLVAQVAGRAGRGTKPGRVVVQTFVPEHRSIQLASRHDYEAFAEMELKDRESFGYPPFTRAMRVVFCGERLGEVEALARQVSDRIQKVAPPGVRLLGPDECGVAVVRNQHRWHLLVLAPEVGMIRYLAQAVERLGLRTRSVTLSLDVDPVNLL